MAIGRSAPVVDVDSVSDVTATGRLQWAAFADGWTLRVCRPGDGEPVGVLFVEARDGRVSYTVAHEHVEAGRVHIRHLDALVRPLRALGKWHEEPDVPEWLPLAARFAVDLEPVAATAWFSALAAEHALTLINQANHMREIRKPLPPCGYVGRQVEEEV